MLKNLYKFLNVWYLKVDCGSAVIDDWFCMIEARARTRGVLECIAYIKACRLAFTRYVSGSPLKQSTYSGLSLYSNGLPKGILWMERLAKGGINEKRLAHSLLLCSRAFPGTVIPNLESITAPPTSQVPTGLVGEVRAVVKSLGWKADKPVWVGPHLSTKAGPNGQSMMGAMSDLQTLSDNMLTDISVLSGGAVNQWIETLKRFSLVSWLAKFGVGKRAPVKTGSDPVHSKLSVIHDREAKARVIAILDYWSQTTLKPIHDTLFGILKRIKGDCTFDQASFRTYLPTEGPYHSLDLSSATDRFPLVLEEAVLAEVFSDDQYGASWARLIADREFKVPWTGGRVKYSCGQPMGAYSSWAAFALAHHAIVRVSAVRAGFPHTYSRYALLGDDIVISDDSVAQHYLAILRQIGVSISDAKSHVSVDTYEFAKRWIHRGEEMTGAPISEVYSIKKKPKWYLLASWIRDVETRWCVLGNSIATRRLFAALYALWGTNPGYAERLSFKAYNFFMLPLKTDPYRVRLTKANYFSSVFFKGIIGCNRYRFATVLMYEWLAEAKTGVLEEAIISQTKRINQFLSELSDLLGLVPEGLDSQSALTKLVPVAAVLHSLQDMQANFEKLRADFTSGRERSIVENGGSYYSSVDPTKVWTARASHRIMFSKASMLNKFAKMANLYVDGRLKYIASDEDVSNEE